MPQVLTLAGVEAELYPDRAEFARRRGSKNRNRFGRRKKGMSLTGRTTAGKLTRAAGAAAVLGGGAALAARSRRGKNWNPVTDPKKLLGGAGTTGQRGGALTKTNMRGYDAGSGGIAGRRKLSLGDRAANLGRGARKKARGAASAVGGAVSRGRQRMTSKSYRMKK